MEEKTEIKVTDKRAVSNVAQEQPTDIVLLSIQKGYSPDFIKQMMELEERRYKEEARRAFHSSMAAFKASPPNIWRDLQVKYQPQGKAPTQWSHSDLGIAADAIGTALAHHDLNHTWRTEQQEDGRIRITCVLTHEMGHSEATSLSGDPDNTGGKNSIQAIGSTTFYLERYTLFAITGLAPARMDNNGMGDNKPKDLISDEQRIALEKIIVEKNVDLEKFLSFLKIEDIEDIPAAQFGGAMSVLKRAKGNKATPEKTKNGENGT